MFWRWRHVVLPQRVRGRAYLGLHVVYEIVVHGAGFSLPGVQLVNFHEIGALAGEFLVSQRIDVKLVLRDFFGLGAVIGFQVNDGRFVGVLAPDKVDAAYDAHAVLQADVDLLFREFDLVKVGFVVVDIVANHFLGSGFHALFQRRIGKGCMQVGLDQARYIRLVGIVAPNGAGMHFGESIVQ